MSKFTITFYIKLLVLLLVSVLYVNRALNDFKEPYIEGDGFEYALLTESIYNHGSPDFQKQDFESFRLDLGKYHNMDNFPKYPYLNGFKDLSDDKKFEFKTGYGGYFLAKNQKFYAIHFFTYSLVSLPAKVICKFANLSPITVFHLTNAFFIIIVCALLLFYNIKNIYVGFFSVISFCFGVNYWYLGWEHTEIFTTCVVAISLILFFRGNKLWSLFVLAIAVTQTQTLLILLGALGVVILIENKINFKLLLKLASIYCIAFIPPLFYYYHFGTTSLIKDMGFMDHQCITVNRFFGFYFDLNQGMILGLPLILPAYIISLFCFALTKFRDWRNLIKHLALPVSVVIITVISSSMTNWNPGQTIVHRYTTWLGAVVFIHFLELLRFNGEKWKLVLLNTSALVQIFICFYFQKINNFEWEASGHKDIAAWVLKYDPDLYNPDPTIFAVRTAQQYDLFNQTAPIFYFDNDHNLKKVLFHKKNIAALNYFGLNPSEEQRLFSYPDNYGWAYLKEVDHKKLRPSGELYAIVRAEKVKAARFKIQSSDPFMAQEKQKAIEWKMTLDQVLDMDAEYLVAEEEKRLKNR
jgi:hypothetical protein